MLPAVDMRSMSVNIRLSLNHASTRKQQAQLRTSQASRRRTFGNGLDTYCFLAASMYSHDSFFNAAGQ